MGALLYKTESNGDFIGLAFPAGAFGAAEVDILLLTAGGAVTFDITRVGTYAVAGDEVNFADAAEN